MFPYSARIGTLRRACSRSPRCSGSSSCWARCRTSSRRRPSSPPSRCATTSGRWPRSPPASRAITLGRVVLALAVRTGFERLQRGAGGREHRVPARLARGAQAGDARPERRARRAGQPDDDHLRRRGRAAPAAGAAGDGLRPRAALVWYSGVVIVASGAEKGIEKLIDRGLQPALHRARRRARGGAAGRALAARVAGPHPGAAHPLHPHEAIAGRIRPTRRVVCATMPHWLLKAAAQGAIAAAPLGDRLDRAARVHVTRSLTIGEAAFATKLRQCRHHVVGARAASAPARPFAPHALELGTGWYPIVPDRPLAVRRPARHHDRQEPAAGARARAPHGAALRRRGAQRGARPTAARRVGRPRRHAARRRRLGRRGGPGGAARAASASTSSSATRATPASTAGSVDLIVSNNTFEHVPRTTLLEILLEFRRVASARAVMSHFVDMADHYAYFDRRALAVPLPALLGPRLAPAQRRHPVPEPAAHLGLPRPARRGRVLDPPGGARPGAAARPRARAAGRPLPATTAARTCWSCARG